MGGQFCFFGTAPARWSGAPVHANKSTCFTNGNTLTACKLACFRCRKPRLPTVCSSILQDWSRRPAGACEQTQNPIHAKEPGEFRGHHGGAAEGSDLECSVALALAQCLHEDMYHPVQMATNLLDLPTSCSWHSHEAKELAPPLLHQTGPCNAVECAQAIKDRIGQPIRCVDGCGEVARDVPDLRITV